jgi:hypothetical protein
LFTTEIIHSHPHLMPLLLHHSSFFSFFFLLLLPCHAVLVLLLLHQAFSFHRSQRTGLLADLGLNPARDLNPAWQELNPGMTESGSSKDGKPQLPVPLDNAKAAMDTSSGDEDEKAGQHGTNDVNAADVAATASQQQKQVEEQLKLASNDSIPTAAQGLAALQGGCAGAPAKATGKAAAAAAAAKTTTPASTQQQQQQEQQQQQQQQRKKRKRQVAGDSSGPGQRKAFPVVQNRGLGVYYHSQGANALGKDDLAVDSDDELDEDYYRVSHG